MVDSNWDIRQELLSQDLSTLVDDLSNKNCSYCPLCNAVTKNFKGFEAHVAGRKHKYQLKKLQKSGLEKWAKKEEQRVRKKDAKQTVAEPFVWKKNNKDIRKPNRPNGVLKDVLVQETIGSSGEKEQKSDEKDVKAEACDKESGSSNYNLLLKTFHSTDSESSCKEAAVIPTSDSNQLKDSSVLASSSEMHPNTDYREPRFNAGPPFHQFHPPHDFYDPMAGARHRPWQYNYPPPIYGNNNNGRFRPMFSKPPRYILPPPAIREGYPRSRHYLEEANASDKTSPLLWKNKHAASSKESEKRYSLENANEPKLQPDSDNNDNFMNPHAGSGNASDQSSTTDVKSEMAQNEVDGGHSSSSVGNDDKRHVTQNKSTKSQASNTQSLIPIRGHSNGHRDESLPNVGHKHEVRLNNQGGKKNSSLPCGERYTEVVTRDTPRYKSRLLPYSYWKYSNDRSYGESRSGPYSASHSSSQDEILRIRSHRRNKAGDAYHQNLQDESKQMVKPFVKPETAMKRKDLHTPSTGSALQPSSCVSSHSECDNYSNKTADLSRDEKPKVKRLGVEARLGERRKSGQADSHNELDNSSSKSLDTLSRNEKSPVGDASDVARLRKSSESDPSGHPCPREKESFISRKSASSLTFGDVSKTRLAPTTSSDTASKSPAFSNVTIQRMNARLQSFAKYGKMPTTSQIRLLAVSGSSAQGKIDGKLQEWSKKIKESHQNLTAQDRELINRLVNYSPCSRLQQKKLECCIREHARSRKKLQLPRFNLQLSGAEISKDPPTVDDTIKTMVTEVVDSLPEDVLNSLISALNSDVDENVTYDFSFGVDGQLSVPSEEGQGMSGVSVTADAKNAISAVGEFVNSSFNEKGPSESHCADIAYSSLCLSAGNSENTSAPEDKVKVAGKSPINPIDHAHLVEDTKPPIAPGSSMGLISSDTSTIIQNNVVKIKQEPLDEDEASKHGSRSLDLNNCKESRSTGSVNSLGMTSSVYPSSEHISAEIKNGENASASKDSRAEVVSFPGVLVIPLLSTPYLTGTGVDLEKLPGVPKDKDIKAAGENPYPGLKYIRNGVETIENRKNAVSSSPPHPQKVKHSNTTPVGAVNNHQDDQAPSFGPTVIKSENAGNPEPKQSEDSLSLQIGSVTGNASFENDDWPVEVKKEPCSPEPEMINIKDSSNEEDEVQQHQEKKIPHVSPSTESIAAAFPGVIPNGRCLSQKEDSEKSAEVSSSTEAFLSEEKRASSFPESGQSCPPLGSGGNVPKSFIQELVEIDSAEEKLIVKTKEADQKIAHLTASLEEWKQKKNQIEQEHMKLRMKRQTLLLTAAKEPASCGKFSTSVQSGSGSKSSVPDDVPSSGESSQTTQSSSSVSDEESSGRELSTLSNQRHKGKSDRKRKRARKKIRVSHGRFNKLKRPSRRVRQLQSDEDSESLAAFSISSCKRRRSGRPHTSADNHSSSGRNPKKKRVDNVKDLQVILQPLQLGNSGARHKIIVNKDDDICIIEEEDDCSVEETGTENTEMEITADNIKVEAVDEQMESVPESTELDNIQVDTLHAHSTAVVDLKVSGDYLYTASLDFTAKRFSLQNPENDCVTYEGHQKAVTSICISPTTNELYTTCRDGHLRCFDIETGNNNFSVDMKNAILCSCEAAGIMYLGLFGGLVIFFNFKLKRQVYELRCGQSSLCKMATVTQGAQRLLCIVSNDGLVSLYDTSTGLLLRCLEGHVQPPCCIQICDNLAYITTSEKSVVLYDLLSGALQRMMNLPASSTGLEVIDNYMLTSSYDGLIRCHDKDQDMTFHSIYYGAGKSMVMCMVAHRQWVFTGNRRGIVEAFRFDPSKQFPCEYGRCRQNFGRVCDVFHHVNIDHMPHVISKTKTCPWRLCSYGFTPRTTVEEKKEHVKQHIAH